MLEASVNFRPIAGGQWLLTGRTVSAGISLRETLERSLAVALAVSVLLGLLCGLIIGQYVDRRDPRHRRLSQTGSAAATCRERVPLSGAGDSFDHALAPDQPDARPHLDADGRTQNADRQPAHDLRSPVGRLRAAADAALTAETPRGARPDARRDHPPVGLADADPDDGAGDRPLGSLHQPEPVQLVRSRAARR